MSAEECDHIVKLADLQGLHESTTLPVPEDDGTGEKCLLTTSLLPTAESCYKMYCEVPENIHTHLRKVNGNSKRKGLVSEAQFFKGKYDTKLEFVEGSGD